ncbi:nucleotide exchange factor GrpE [Azospirillum sp. RWY-5-1]|uniref:Protein GrpE n=1 Tax=Azospirillum oleiclasticum TaxID=2735135 RepID=A0ABX2TKF7_9PROT|nr:nucleotide exchange factor GrpE [Azospirillum oleiclasticum]NYZ24721.1 nucleotide exchange factor GrpE [Azospirillum oleiclasticum]
MSDPNTKPNDSANPTEAPATAEAAAPSDERVAKLEAEVSSLKDQLLRAMAETENTRRRAQREREDTAKFAVSSFAKELLAVSDNLRRALEAVPAEARETDDVMKNLAVGVEATERQLAAAFERAGIRKLEPMGEPFDPNFHQVMFEIENTGKPAGTIVQVLQAGYTIHGRLLREAMVGVAKRGADEPVHVDTKA